MDYLIIIILKYAFYYIFFQFFLAFLCEKFSFYFKIRDFTNLTNNLFHKNYAEERKINVQNSGLL